MPNLPGLSEELIDLNELRARGSMVHSSVVLIIANLVVLAGVLFLGWSKFDVLFTYWLESVVIGFFTVLKLKKAGKTAPMPAPFFIVHYGMFSFAMFMCIVGFFGPGGYSNSMTARKMSMTTGYLLGDGFLNIGTAAVSFLISHGFSYWHNFLGKHEYRDRRIVKYLVTVPYQRLFLTILIVFFTTLIAPKFNLPLVSAAVLLIILKTAMDLTAHLRQHRVTKNK